MNPDLLNVLLQNKVTQATLDAQERIRNPVSVKRVVDKTLSYTARHRGQFYRPEYDFDQIMIAESRDGFIGQSIQKKVNRVVVAGWNWTGHNQEAVDYIRRRTDEMSWATGVHFDELLTTLFHDQFRFNNHVWVKVRDEERSSGKTRKDRMGNLIEPVAGYFYIGMETLEFKSKPNGDLIKVRQKLPDGKYKDFLARDIVHFYTNKNPGFSVGTPTILPALDDIALLRRIEENVEDLIESNLFPMFHYKIGSDTFPERYTPEGRKESDIAKAAIDYMPSGGVYVSDHRHEISRVGSEGAALRIDYYITHFKNRALSALGTSALDMGEGGGANRSTASTLSKGMLMDIEAMTRHVKRMIEFHVVNELLLEGGYDPFDDMNRVELRFGFIDKEERRADENQQIQLWSANLQTMDEARSQLGFKPWEDEYMDRTFHKMFAEPAALAKGGTEGGAALETLAHSPSSNISPEAVSKGKEFAKAVKSSTGGAQGKPASRSGSANASKAKSRPSNQHGTRSSAKTTHDMNFELPDGSSYSVACNVDLDRATVQQWIDDVWDRYGRLSDSEITFDTLASTMQWRLQG